MKNHGIFQYFSTWICFYLVILDDRCKEKPQKSYPKIPILAASEDTGLEKSNQSHFLAQVIPMVITMAGLWLVYGWYVYVYYDFLSGRFR